MKMSVKLVILFATLLLLTGVAFAQDCECYETTWTGLDNPANSMTGYSKICLDYENHTGEWNGCLLSLFPGWIKQGLVYDPSCCAVYFKFHGENNNVITADEACPERFTIWGHKTESCPTPSDVTWKKNIEPLSSSLEKVLLLQGVSYDWKTDEYPEIGFTKNRQIGFIAQDVEKVFPELVQTDNNGYKAVYYAQMVPVLLEAIKEQQKEIAELKKQQAMMAELTDKIAQLEKALGEKGSKVSSE